jgi:hypothetical protein
MGANAGAGSGDAATAAASAPAPTAAARQRNTAAAAAAGGALPGAVGALQQLSVTRVKVGTPVLEKLVYNYRSHSGILDVAAAVCELLYHFFKGSLDQLPADTGLFCGPKPVVLDLDSVEDLMILLLGNRRESDAQQAIEFGAQQVVLVRNEAAREAMPEEVREQTLLTTAR